MIRNVRTADAQAIADIYNYYVARTTISFETSPVSQQAMARRIAQISAAHPYLVYETSNGEIAGYCYVHPWKERAAYHLTLETTVYCAQQHLHQGIGKALMDTLIEECRHRGYKALIACITADNTASIDFHRRLGFEQVSHFKQVGHKLGKMLDVIDLELLL